MRSIRGATSPVEQGLIKVGKEIFNDVLKFFGKENKEAPEPLLQMRTYPSIVKGKSSADTNLHFEKAQEFYDYLINPEADMMRIELEILGDPAFVAQDMYITLGDDEQHGGTSQKNAQFGVGTVFSEEYQSFNVDQYMPMIKLNYRLPADIDETNGTMFTKGKGTLADNLFFGGIYQVVKVESKMDSGQFTQVLTCVRLNNQQGKGELAEALHKSSGVLIEEKKKKNITSKVNVLNEGWDFGLGPHDGS